MNDLTIEMIAKSLADLSRANSALPADGPCSMTEILNFFGISKKTFYQWQEAMDDFPKPVKIGNRLRWDANEIRAFWLKRKELNHDG